MTGQYVAFVKKSTIKDFRYYGIVIDENDDQILTWARIEEVYDEFHIPNLYAFIVINKNNVEIKSNLPQEFLMIWKLVESEIKELMKDYLRTNEIKEDYSRIELLDAVDLKSYNGIYSSAAAKSLKNKLYDAGLHYSFPKDINPNFRNEPCEFCLGNVYEVKGRNESITGICVHLSEKFIYLLMVDNSINVCKFLKTEVFKCNRIETELYNLYLNLKETLDAMDITTFIKEIDADGNVKTFVKCGIYVVLDPSKCFDINSDIHKLINEYTEKLFLEDFNIINGFIFGEQTTFSEFFDLNNKNSIINFKDRIENYYDELEFVSPYSRRDLTELGGKVYILKNKKKKTKEIRL